MYGPGSPYSFDLTAAPHQLYKRRLGPTEISYYLGSRGEGVESGVNDMSVNLKRLQGGGVWRAVQKTDSRVCSFLSLERYLHIGSSRH